MDAMSTPPQGDSTRIRRPRWMDRIATGILIAALPAAFLYYEFGPPTHQARNMEAARQHLLKVEPLLRQETRFGHVRAFPYTALDGSLGVYGFVKCEQDLADLRRIVEGTSPPVQVCWLIQAVPSPDWEDLIEKEPTNQR